VDPEKVRFKDIESNIVRCPDKTAAAKMIRLIEKMRRAGDSVGGIVEGVARGVPPGWGEPVFDKLEADLAKAMLSLPASKAFEIGSGFGGILLTGRQHNDPFRARHGRVFTTTNRSGGIQGGISNGQTIFSASPSSRWPPLCIRRTRWTNSSVTRRLPAAVGMIRACCHAPCPWSKP
jgi:chorismate synthase